MGRWEWHADLGGWLWVWDNGEQDRGSTASPSAGQGGYSGQAMPQKAPPAGTPNGTRADAVMGSGAGRWEWHEDLGGWLWVWDNGEADRGSTPSPTSGQGGYNGQAKPAQPGGPLANGTIAPNLGTAPAPGSGLTSTQQSAKASLDSFLGGYGLQGLGDFAWNEYLQGVPLEQIMLDIRARPEYQARFPGMAQLAAKGQAISETQYIQLEKDYTSAFRQAGLPAGFYDQPSDFGNLIANSVSPNELGHRLDLYSQVIYSSDPEVTNQLKSLYGLSDGDILAYTIDPTKALPILQKQYQAAQESAAGVLSGFGALSQSEAERLALLGVSTQQAMAGFNKLGNETELFTSLPGERGMNPITREQELGAEFQGNAQDQQAIERIRQYRLGQFQGGGGYAATSKGVAGLEAAQT